MLKKGKTKKQKKRSNVLSWMVMLTVFASFCLNSACKPKVIITPSTEIGEIEIYGFIKDGIIPDDILAEIKDKNPAIVSKGFLYQYWRMKRLLEINEIEIY